MASVARVNRRLRQYYLIVRLLPNVFALAYRSLGSIYYDTGSPHDGKTPFGWLHPCRLVTDSRRYLIVGASAAMPLYSSFIFNIIIYERIIAVLTSKNKIKSTVYLDVKNILMWVPRD